MRALDAPAPTDRAESVKARAAANGARRAWRGHDTADKGL
jgi:hypothetical protein